LSCELLDAGDGTGGFCFFSFSGLRRLGRMAGNEGFQALTVLAAGSKNLYEFPPVACIVPASGKPG